MHHRGGVTKRIAALLPLTKLLSRKRKPNYLPNCSCRNIVHILFYFVERYKAVGFSIRPTVSKCLIKKKTIAEQQRYRCCAYENLDHRGGNGSDFNAAHALCTYSRPGIGIRYVLFRKSHAHSGELDIIPPLSPVQLSLTPKNGVSFTRH